MTKPKTSREIAEENARWYRELVSGSSANTTREGSLSTHAGAVEEPAPEASTSKVTLDDLAAREVPQQTRVQGEGSKEEPFTLHDEDEQATSDRNEPLPKQNTLSPESSDGSFRHQAQKNQPTRATNVEGNSEDEENLTVSPSEDPAAEEVPEPDSVEGEPQDMYCLLCKTVVPAADVAGHRTSILHQLSKTSHKGNEPLVPPTHYGVRSSNVGYGMLQRLGWIEDTGLGTSQIGRKTPLKASDKHDRKGLGVDSKRRIEHEEREGKIVKKSKQVPQAAAKPLAKNRKELERAKKREMQMFKEGLAYLNT